MSSQIDFIVDKAKVSSAVMKIKKSGWFEFGLLYYLFSSSTSGNDWSVLSANHSHRLESEM